MRNPDRAAANEFSDHGVTGKNLMAGGLLARQAFD
jgi:hypothetical protein